MIKGGWQFVNSARNAGSSAGGDPWAPLDGRLGAPSQANIIFPTKLNGYGTGSAFSGAPATGRYRWPTKFTWPSGGPLIQPPWMVSGIDYPVGIDRSLYRANVNLKDPSLIQPAGTTFQIGAGLNGSNQLSTDGSQSTVVIDGFDFSLHNGICLGDTGSGAVNSVTISNCNMVSGSAFGTGTNIGTPWGMGGPNMMTVIVRNCEINGTGLPGNSQRPQVPFNIQLIAAGSQAIIEYNYIHDAQGQTITYTQSKASFLTQFNVIADAGEGQDIGAHGDWIQCYNNGQLVNNPPTGTYINQYKTQFNLFFQSQIPSVENTEGISDTGVIVGYGMLYCLMNNNTLLSPHNTNVNNFLRNDLSFVEFTTTTNSNFIDSTGTRENPPSTIVNIANSGVGSFNGQWISDNNNVDMSQGIIVF